MDEVSTPWAELDGRSVTVPAHVVLRKFAQETVLLNIRTGQYHGIDRVGARFFEAMCDAPTLQAASETLALEYGQDLERIRADLAAFLAELRARDLVLLSDA